MFILRKLLTAISVPPGLFIVLALAIAVFARKRFRLYLVVLAVLVYALSIEPVKNLILHPLEYAYPVPTLAEIGKADTYVVLSGGANADAPDIEGKGALGPESLERVYGAYALYSRSKKPVILSGGSVDDDGGPPESAIAQKVLLRLGVRPEHILIETASRTTEENAARVKELSEKKKLQRIVLVTNALHMPRSVMLFKRLFPTVVPYPTGFRSGERNFSFYSFLPDTGTLTSTSLALREYLGILYYRIRFMGKE